MHPKQNKTKAANTKRGSTPSFSEPSVKWREEILSKEGWDGGRRRGTGA